MVDGTAARKVAFDKQTMTSLDCSEFHFWCFVVHDLNTANKIWNKMHDAPSPVTMKLGQAETHLGPGVARVHEWLRTTSHKLRNLYHPQEHHHEHGCAAYALFAAGALGGGTATYSTHWLDTVKVKMQTFPKMYPSGMSTLKMTLSTEGVRGLYQGAIPAVLGQTLKSAIVFTSYGVCEEVVCNLARGGDFDQLTVWDHALAGAMSGVVASFALCPLELIKCRRQALQSQVLNAYRQTKPNLDFKRGGMISMVRHIMKTDGVRGFYRGLPGIWMKEIPGSFIYFGSYEMAKSLLYSFNGSEHLGSRAVFMCGVFAGLCFCITHPIESVKTRVQVMSALSSTGGFIKSAVLILRTEGIKPLCSGMRPTMLRACTYSGIQFMIYENIKDFFMHH